MFLHHLCCSSSPGAASSTAAAWCRSARWAAGRTGSSTLTSPARATNHDVSTEAPLRTPTMYRSTGALKGQLKVREDQCDVMMSVSRSGQGVTVCDKLQCVCDKTTAECMSAAHFNHSLPSQQCRGPAPPCRRASRPPKPRASPESSESSEEPQGGGSDAETTDGTKHTAEPNTPPPAAQNRWEEALKAGWVRTLLNVNYQTVWFHTDVSAGRSAVSDPLFWVVIQPSFLMFDKSTLKWITCYLHVIEWVWKKGRLSLIITEKSGDFFRIQTVFSHVFVTRWEEKVLLGWSLCFHVWKLGIRRGKIFLQTLFPAVSHMKKTSGDIRL